MVANSTSSTAFLSRKRGFKPINRAFLKVLGWQVWRQLSDGGQIGGQPARQNSRGRPARSKSSTRWRRQKKTHRVAVDLSVLELERIRCYFQGVACTDAWLEEVMSAVRAKTEAGRRVIPYSTTDEGRLKTKMPRLLEMIADHFVFPPPADDVSYCDLATGTHHVGSAMARCACVDCSSGGKRVMWPAHYLINGVISFACEVTRNRVSLDVLWGMGLVQSDEAPGGGRYVTAKDIAESKRWDADAWRRDGIGHLGIEDQAGVEDPPRSPLVGRCRKPDSCSRTGNDRIACRLH